MPRSKPAAAERSAVPEVELLLGVLDEETRDKVRCNLEHVLVVVSSPVRPRPLPVCDERLICVLRHALDVLQRSAPTLLLVCLDAADGKLDAFGLPALARLALIGAMAAAG